MRVIEPLVPPAVLERPGAAERSGILVHGLVTDTTGAPPATIPDGPGVLEFTGETGIVHEARLEASGSYAVAGLTPGRWRVQLMHRGHSPVDRVLLLAEDEPVRRCDFVLELVTALLVSAFTSDGRPLRDVLAEQAPPLIGEHGLAVIATHDEPAPELDEPAGGFEHYGMGRFRDGGRLFRAEPDLPRGALGRLEVHEPLPAFVSLLFRGLLLQSQHVAAGADAVTFTVPANVFEALRGGLRLRVVDTVTAAPLTEARALLTETNEFAFDGGLAPDAAGRLSWERELPGLRRLQIDCAGHEQWVANVRVPAGDVADLGTVALDALAHISGTVRDAAGAPQVVPLIALCPSREIVGQAGDHIAIESSDDGSFRLDNLGRREYELRVRTDDLVARPVYVDTSNGDVDGVIVTVEPGTLVTFDLQWPVTRQLEVEIPTNINHSGMRRHALWGSATLPLRMVAGDYKALLFDGATLVREIPFAVRGEQALVALAPP